MEYMGLINKSNEIFKKGTIQRIVPIIYSYVDVIVKKSYVCDPLELIANKEFSIMNKSLIETFHEKYNILEHNKCEYASITVPFKDSENNISPYHLYSVIIDGSNNNITEGLVKFNNDTGLIVMMYPKNEIKIHYFILAHELAHIYLGLLDKDKKLKEISGIYKECMMDIVATHIYALMTISDRETLKDRCNNIVKVLNFKNTALNEARHKVIMSKCEEIIKLMEMS